MSWGWNVRVFDLWIKLDLTCSDVFSLTELVRRTNLNLLIKLDSYKIMTMEINEVIDPKTTFSNDENQSFAGKNKSEKKFTNYLDLVAEHIGYRILRSEGCIIEHLENNLVRVTNPKFQISFHRKFAAKMVKACFSRDPELIVGESYMANEWSVESGDLVNILSLFWRIATSKNLLKTIRRITNYKRFSNWQKNSPSISRENIKKHYDNNNEANSLFSSMLGEVPCYSSGIFEKSNQNLAQAQKLKIDKLAKLIDIKKHNTVLDIGSGWGVLTTHLAKLGANVTGLTLSAEQLIFCKSISKSHSFLPVKYHLKDYRDYFKSQEVEYDRITCIEVLDHIGLHHFDEFFRLIQTHLKPNGLFVAQLILRPKAGQTSGWIDKYIYPGGYIASMSEVKAVYEKYGFIVTHSEEIDGYHYAQTLRCWRENFDKAWRLSNQNSEFDSGFYNMWMFFFAYSIVAFEQFGFSNHHLVLKKCK